MKITGEGGEWSLLKEWTSHSLSRVLVIKLRWQSNDNCVLISDFQMLAGMKM